MSPFEKVFLEFGWSWQWSKVLPYFFILIAVLAVMWLMKRTRTINRQRGVLLVLSVFLFSGVHIACYPIYETDFVDLGEMKQPTPSFSQMTTQDVNVLVIPGCPLCKESFEISRLLKSRNPKLNITYVVVDNDPQNLNDFKKMAKGNFKVILVANIGEVTRLVDNKFPSFLMRKNNHLKLWSYAQIGACSLDQMEKISK